MHDPIADMLTRIRNAQGAKLQLTSMSSSKLKEQIAQVLKDEGYINNFSVTMNEKGFKILDIDLKYYHGKAVIERIKRVSRPGLRIYKACKDLNPIPGFGIIIYWLKVQKVIYHMFLIVWLISQLKMAIKKFYILPQHLKMVMLGRSVEQLELR